MKAEVKAVMAHLGGTKLIAYSWPSIDLPLVMNSRGQRQASEAFDPEKAKAFCHANLNRAPEPNAP